METITVQFIVKELSDEKRLLEWCMNAGLIADKCVCSKCGKFMKLCKRKDVRDKYAWRCMKRGLDKHDVRMSVRKNSWFESSHLCMYDILLITHMWCMKAMNQFIQREVKVAVGTVVEWKKCCRDMCVELCVQENEMLGGEGVIVEIGQCKFEKQNSQRGKRVDGQWVFGGVEKGTNKCFMCVVEERSADVLLQIISKNILPGTIIISDCWKSYKCLSSDGYKHLIDKHSIQFKNPQTSAQTNSIEGTWRAIKRSIGKNHCTDLNSYLCEYIWRRRHKHDDLTQTFLKGIKKRYPPLQ